MMKFAAVCCAFVFTVFTVSAHAGATLDKIKSSGTMPCGIDTEEPEYSTRDAHGNHSAFDIDICKAVAVAILGPEAKFTILPFRAEQDALKALKSGEIAMLATASLDLLNTSAQGLGFARPIFFDYQGFLVNKTMNVASVKRPCGQEGMLPGRH